MRSEGLSSALSAGKTPVCDWSILSGRELEYAADSTPGSDWIAASARCWKARPRSSEYPAKPNSNAVVETRWGSKPRFICSACWSPRKESREADTSTKHSATCTTTSMSRQASRLRPQLVEPPLSTTLGSALEARQPGAEPKSPAATSGPAIANRNTRQAGLTSYCTGKSMGPRNRLSACDRTEAATY